MSVKIISTLLHQMAQNNTTPEVQFSKLSKEDQQKVLLDPKSAQYVRKYAELAAYLQDRDVVDSGVTDQRPLEVVNPEEAHTGSRPRESRWKLYLAALWAFGNIEYLGIQILAAAITDSFYFWVGLAIYSICVTIGALYLMAAWNIIRLPWSCRCCRSHNANGRCCARLNSCLNSCGKGCRLSWKRIMTCCSGSFFQRVKKWCFEKRVKEENIQTSANWISQ